MAPMQEITVAVLELMETATEVDFMETTDHMMGMAATDLTMVKSMDLILVRLVQ